MAARTVSTPTTLEPPVAVAALGSALLLGVLVAFDAPLALAALVALAYAPLALVNLPLGLALWVPLMFLEGLPALNAGGKAAGLLVAAAWIAGGGGLAAEVSALITRHRALMTTLALYLLWVTVSVAWAASVGSALGDLWHWYVVALIFVVVITTLRTTHAVRMTLHLFVVGAVISAALGVVLGGVGGSSQVDLAAASSGRLYGAAGDPNILAAGLIPAAVLAAALASSTRSTVVRGWLVFAIGALSVATVASESRGGFLAAIVTALAALVFFRRRRAQVLVLVLLVCGAAGAWLLSSPAAWSRLTSFQDGSGRTDIWRVALRVGADQPIIGVGLNNFQEVSYKYVRRPGAIKVYLLVDRPKVAHNMYLETYADTGLVGLALFMGFVASCLRAAWLAGRRFEAEGDAGLEAIARAVLVGTIGFLAAAVFISSGVDKRLWLLLALGPALYALSLRRDAATAVAGG